MSGFRILFLEPQPCIRALKCADALRFSLGESVSLCFGYTGYSLDSLYGYGDACFDRLVKLDINELDQGIRALINDFDPTLIHSHNAPNTLTLSAVGVAEDVPIIHDVHEVLSVHNSGFEANDDDESLSQYCEEERRANEESDGRIYATEGIGEYVQQHYDVDTANDLVFYNYVSESVMPRNFKEKLSKGDGDVHIVYIGCITSVVEGSHYDLRHTFKDIASHGMHIHIYPTSNLITLSNDSYKKLADSNEFIHFYSNMHRKELLKEITQYDFGWAGFNGAENKKHLDIAFPNKVMEYVACGLPVLAFPHKTIQRFIEHNGVGLVFDDIDELEELLKNGSPPNIRETILNSRHCFAIENQISRVVDFYEQILGRGQTLREKDFPSGEYGVIVVTRNGAKTISSTLNSIMDQTVRPIILCVVDDGSTDDTPQLLKKFSEKFPNRVCLLTLPNKGYDIRRVIARALTAQLASMGRGGSDTKVTKRRKISKDLVAFGFKGELLEVVEEILDLRSAVKLERRLNRLRTAKEREEEVYWVEEE